MISSTLFHHSGTTPIPHRSPFLSPPKRQFPPSSPGNRLIGSSISVSRCIHGHPQTIYSNEDGLTTRWRGTFIIALMTAPQLRYTINNHCDAMGRIVKTSYTSKLHLELDHVIPSRDRCPSSSVFYPKNLIWMEWARMCAV